MERLPRLAFTDRDKGRHPSLTSGPLPVLVQPESGKDALKRWQCRGTSNLTSEAS